MHCTRLYLMALNDHSKGEDTMRKRIRVLISALLVLMAVVQTINSGVRMKVPFTASGDAA